MKNRIVKSLAAVLIIAAFAVSAFAGGYYASDESGNTSVPDYIESVEVSGEGASIPKEAENNTYELTPDGNLTLVDDYYEETEEDEISKKQFLTVTTKAGNTFYIVVDRDGDNDNVYLLNLVDEADLMALINDEEVTVTTTETTTEESTSAETTEEETTEKKSNMGTVVIFLIIAGGGFAVYWFKFRKKEPKEDNENSEDNDNIDLGEVDFFPKEVNEDE